MEANDRLQELFRTFHLLVIKNRLWKNLDIVYLDLPKAFESVVYSKLIYKLDWFGITDNLLVWLTEFLTGRFQCTVINKVKSLCEPVISGVPQGCVLGPIIFILFLNDLPQYVNSFSPGSADSLKMYANDIKIYCIVNTLYQAINFQKTNNIISDWCRTWQLTVNISDLVIIIV